MIFTLREIEDRITLLSGCGDDIERSAQKYKDELLRARLLGCASGFREAAAILERMVQDCLADEAQSYLA